MIQIPLTAAVLVVILLHTALTHLLNWGMRKTNHHEIMYIFHLLEVILITMILCNMKPV